MLIHKPRRFSRAEEATYRDCLRQLQAEAIDVEIPEDGQENSRALDIVVAGPTESAVFESATGGVNYAVLARFVALRSGLTLSEWSLCTHYDEQIVPESFEDGSPECKLGGREYQLREVLNMRIEKDLVLRRGQIVEGWLLATGIAPIPAEYRNFAVVPFHLSLWDQFGNEIDAEGKLSVLRKARRDDIAVQKGRSLYGMDMTGKPRELSVEEDSRRRYRELVAQDELAAQQKSRSD
jgi:hypothetical protein